MTLVLTGKVIERGAKERAMRALTLLHRLMPGKARLVQDGHERFVSVEALQAGAIFRVKSGERLPADGIVPEGARTWTRACSPANRRRCPKDRGRHRGLRQHQHRQACWRFAPPAWAAESTLARIVRTVEQAAASRTQMERSVDRVARLFIPGRAGAGGAHLRGLAVAHRKARGPR